MQDLHSLDDETTLKVFSNDPNPLLIFGNKNPFSSDYILQQRKIQEARSIIIYHLDLISIFRKSEFIESLIINLNNTAPSLKKNINFTFKENTPTKEIKKIENLLKENREIFPGLSNKRKDIIEVFGGVRSSKCILDKFIIKHDNINEYLKIVFGDNVFNIYNILKEKEIIDNAVDSVSIELASKKRI